jgi:cytochrome c5
MSDPHGENPQSPIKTPRQLITVVVLAFLVPIILIVLLVTFVTSRVKPGAGSEAMSSAAIDSRIAPLATLDLVDTSASKTLKSGEAVYKAVCTTCHAAGVAGAPKFGNASDWQPRIAQGVNTLWEHALKGYKSMPAKGGNPDLDDIEVERAVVYMANAGGAKFTDPPLPAPGAATAAAAAPAPALGSTPDPAIVAAIAAANSGAAAAPAAAPAAPAAAPAAGTASNDPGQKLFAAVCSACHGAGIAGAPKFGDKAAWAPHIAKGLDTLYDHAIHGIQEGAAVMPPKGGSNASDDDVKAAVRYMVNGSK